MKTLLSVSSTQHHAPVAPTGTVHSNDLRKPYNQSHIEQEIDPFLKKISTFIEDHLQDKICIEDLCSVVYYSRVQVFRKIKSLTGQSPSRFIRSIRLQKALVLLQTTTDTIPEIALKVGFDDSKYFFRVFRMEYGVAPTAMRLKNK